MADLTRQFGGQLLRLLDTQGFELEQPEGSLLQSGRDGVEGKAVGAAQRQPHDVACECAEVVDQIGDAHYAMTVGGPLSADRALMTSLAIPHRHLHLWYGWDKPTMSAIVHHGIRLHNDQSLTLAGAPSTVRSKLEFRVADDCRVLDLALPSGRALWRRTRRGANAWRGIDGVHDESFITVSITSPGVAVSTDV